MIVNISAEAEEDLKDVYNYVAQDSISYARKLITELIDLCEQVGAFPEAGRIIQK